MWPVPDRYHAVYLEAERHNQTVKEKLLAILKELDPRAFEELVGDLLVRIGFEEVQVTPYSGDHGIDVTARLSAGGVTSVRTAIQVKRYANNVPGPVVRELRGSIGVQERGLIITTAGFARDAIAEADSPGKAPISPVNGEQLVELLVQHKLGVRTVNVPVLELDAAELGAPDLQGEADAVTEARQRLSAPRLPGENPVNTLRDLIAFIGQQEPTRDALAGWTMDRFPSYRSWKHVPEAVTQLGLATKQGFRYRLTAAGVRLRESDCAPDTVWTLLCDRIGGFRELMAMLTESPGTVGELHQRLREQLGLSWETTRQTELRLTWLRHLGLAETDANRIWHAKN